MHEVKTGSTFVKHSYHIPFLGMFSAAAGLIIAGYLDADIVDSVIFITISVGLNGMINAGFFINHIDIAPQYAGVLMSFSNTAAGIPGIVGPIVAKAITKKV